MLTHTVQYLNHSSSCRQVQLVGYSMLWKYSMAELKRKGAYRPEVRPDVDGCKVNAIRCMVLREVLACQTTPPAAPLQVGKTALALASFCNRHDGHAAKSAQLQLIT